MRKFENVFTGLNLFVTGLVVLATSAFTSNRCEAGQGGACCLPNGSCVVAESLGNCQEHDGVFQGPGTSCNPNPCQTPTTGACCFGVECVSNTTSTDCTNNEGVFQGPGTTCAGNPCAPPQACCFQNGTCDTLTPAACGSQGGVTYDGQSCINVPCGLGACCTTVSCIANTSAYDCLIQGYVHQGTGTLCTPNPCGSFLQACCFEDTTCQNLTFNDCAEAGGTPQGQGSNCAEADCGSAACCLPAQGCQLLSAGACGVQGGIPLGGASCTPNPCANGACCTTTCVVADAHFCIANGYSFQGAGTECTPGLCVQPCVCINDVNHDFTYNAADIQAFVNCATGVTEDCACADNDFDGATTSADIPSFINSIMNTTGECL